MLSLICLISIKYFPSQWRSFCLKYMQSANLVKKTVLIFLCMTKPMFNGWNISKGLACLSKVPEAQNHQHFLGCPSQTLQFFTFLVPLLVRSFPWYPPCSHRRILKIDLVFRQYNYTRPITLRHQLDYFYWIDSYIDSWLMQMEEAQLYPRTQGLFGR